MNAIDQRPGEVGERDQVLTTREPLRLEAPHLAWLRRRSREPLTTDNPAHGWITRQTVGIVHVVVASEPPEYGLTQQAGQTCRVFLPRRPSDSTAPAISVRASFSSRNGSRRIGSDVGTVELQLETPIEIEPKSVRFRFTRSVRHDRPRSDDVRC